MPTLGILLVFGNSNLGAAIAAIAAIVVIIFGFGYDFVESLAGMWQFVLVGTTNTFRHQHDFVWWRLPRISVSAEHYQMPVPVSFGLPTQPPTPPEKLITDRLTHSGVGGSSSTEKPRIMIAHRGCARSNTDARVQFTHAPAHCAGTGARDVGPNQLRMLDGAR